MANLEHYPNPVRLFSQTRNTWFKELIESFGVPIHVFTNIRDTQLGQLFFAIEVMRLKKRRSGEDPGPSIFENESGEEFIPVFQTLNQFQKFLELEKIGMTLDDFKVEFSTNENVKLLKKIGKTDDEWFSTLDTFRLDEIFIPSAKIFLELIIPTIGKKFRAKKIETIFKKISDLDPNFGLTLQNLCDPVIVNAIENDTYKLDEKDSSIRIIEADKENPIHLNYNDYHGRVNILYSMVAEIMRYFKEGKKYNRNFQNISHLLTLEMLLMIPTPDKARTQLVKQYINEVKEKKPSIPKEFWEIISLSYQGFCQVNDPNTKMFQKVFKGIEKQLRDQSRTLWKKYLYILDGKSKTGNEEVNHQIALLWAHFRVVQAQAQNLHQQQHGEHEHQNYTYRAMLRFEHIFWQQGNDYLVRETYLDKYHFWATYAKIANREIRTPKDSLASFAEFETLMETTRVLTNKTKRKLFDINLRDQKFLIQAMLSYGVEGRDGSIYKKLEKYAKMLEKLLAEIEENLDDFPEIVIEDEKKTVESIQSYLKLPIPESEQLSQRTRGAPTRRLRAS
jgi:hypothetical protein